VRKSSAITFLILLLANGLGFYAYYFFELWQIKKEMRESLKTLPDENLEVLALTMEQYHDALVEDWEIKVDGKMYDVARVSREDGVIKVFGLHDAKEDNLFLLLGEIIAKPLHTNHKIPSIAVAYLSLIFIATAIFILMPPVEYMNRLSFYPFPATTFYLEIPLPPPKR
jgi:hypothetical protein